MKLSNTLTSDELAYSKAASDLLAGGANGKVIIYQDGLYICESIYPKESKIGTGLGALEAFFDYCKNNNIIID